MMLAALLTSSALALILAGPPTENTEASDLTAYEAARAGIGPDSDAHVRLALWCEAHGLQAERLKHLAIAVIANPRHSMARGLMGLVEYRGRWQRPETISEKTKGDVLLAEYRDRRDQTKDDPDAQWTLALWCDEHGLKDEAAAHFTAVVKRDPKRDAAWRRLGFKKQGQRWVTDAQLTGEKAEADRQKQADRHWRPLLEKWRDGLDSKSAKRRAESETGLAGITDPRAVPVLWAVFTGNAQRQAVAVPVLGQIDAPGASRALAMLAAFGDSPEIRRTATETLKRRDPREFANVLIGFLRDPIKYEVKPVGGPGSPGELFIEGTQANVSRRYSPPKSPVTNALPGDQLVYDGNGLPVIQRPMGIVGRTPMIPASNLFFASSTGTIGQSLSAAKKQEFLNMMTRSGLGATKGQQIGQSILNTNTSSFPIVPGLFVGNIDPTPYQAMALGSLAVRAPGPTTAFSFDIGQIAMIPVGQMELEAQKTAAVAQQQLKTTSRP
ncbi:HEAT repeat domain-containing protein [Singulisphaera sp. Ch08]|uniref:HEAT repeat domain-containing protein n=1 Tax=Singulisphaera sp. Ch08 TaxID=3120278 RepID=A0AAU7CLW5_9BACT